MWPVRVAAGAVVTVMLLQRSGTDRQHSSGAHVETVGSQGAADEVIAADVAVVSASSEVLVIAAVDVGDSEDEADDTEPEVDDSEDEIDNAEDEVESVEVTMAYVEVSSGKVIEADSSTVVVLSDGALKVSDSDAEGDSEAEVVGVITMVSSVEVGVRVKVGGTEGTIDSEVDDAV